MLNSLTHDSRDVSARIDDRIESAVPQSAQPAIAISEHVLSLGKEFGATLATVEKTDLMASGKGEFGERAADEACAAEDKNLHCIGLPDSDKTKGGVRGTPPKEERSFHASQAAKRRGRPWPES